MDLNHVCEHHEGRQIQFVHAPRLTHPLEECVGSGELCEVCVELKSSEIAMLELHSQLDALHHTRLPLLAARNNQHDRLTQRLPPELISQIFMACSEPFSPHSPVDPIPFILASVSSTWRHIAHSTLELWTTINVDLERSAVDSIVYQFERCRHLQLAVRVCLSPHLRSGPEDDSDEAPNGEALADLVLAHLDHVHTLVIDLLPSDLSFFYHSKALLKTCSLKELHFHAKYTGYDGLTPSFKLADQVSVEQICTQRHHPSQLLLDWTTVRNLRLSDIQYSASLVALWMAPLLSEVEINLGGDDDLLDYPEHLPLIKESVKTLTLHGITTVSTIIEDISTPALASLNLLRLQELNLALPSILSFLDHSSQNLTELAIEILEDFDHSDLIAIFGAIPNLTSLSVLHRYGTRAELDLVFERLVVDTAISSLPPLLPKLEKLVLAVDPPPLDWDLLLKMIGSRQHLHQVDSDPENTPPTSHLRRFECSLIEATATGIKRHHVTLMKTLRQSGCSFDVQRTLSNRVFPLNI